VQRFIPGFLTLDVEWKFEQVLPRRTFILGHIFSWID